MKALMIIALILMVAGASAMSSRSDRLVDAGLASATIGGFVLVLSPAIAALLGWPLS